MRTADARYFFDPAGPSIGGVSVPQEIQNVAEAIAGKVLSLQDVLNALKIFPEWKAEADHDCILLSREVRARCSGTVKQCFRFIKFRRAER